LAALNHRGLVLANKGPNNNNHEDEYDENNENNEKSKIYFQSLYKEIEINKFFIELPDQEGAEALCIGNDWFSVATDTGYIRVFGFSGYEIVNFKIMRPFVALCAYENLLVIAFLDSVPMFGCQMIKARVFDVD